MLAGRRDLLHIRPHEFNLIRVSFFVLRYCLVELLCYRYVLADDPQCC